MNEGVGDGCGWMNGRMDVERIERERERDREEGLCEIRLFSCVPWLSILRHFDTCGERRTKTN